MRYNFMYEEHLEPIITVYDLKDVEPALQRVAAILMAGAANDPERNMQIAIKDFGSMYAPTHPDPVNTHTNFYVYRAALEILREQVAQEAA